MVTSPGASGPGLSEAEISSFPSLEVERPALEVGRSPTSPILTTAGPFRVCANATPPTPITPTTTIRIQQLISTPLTNLICVHLRLLAFVIGHSAFFRHSDFGFRHSPAILCRQ
jgi:hypothetical protein